MRYEMRDKRWEMRWDEIRDEMWDERDDELYALCEALPSTQECKRQYSLYIYFCLAR